MDAETQAKMKAAESYLRAYEFTEIETDPPGSILHAEFHTIRALLAPGEYRFLGLKKVWLQGKATPQKVAQQLEHMGAALALKGDFGEVYVMDDDNMKSL